MSHPTAAFANLLDLASSRLGGTVPWASDDFFAEKENLLVPERAVFDPHAYTDRGKEMDGWESRRRRSPGHDVAIVKLGVPGVIRGVDVDTDHFLGNHPPHASLDGCVMPPDATADDLRAADWRELLAPVPLAAGSRNLYPIGAEGRFTHVRLHIYPDGGVARLRVYGEPRPDRPAGACDLAAAENGGKAVACSDMFFSPMDNLIAPGRPETMGGGWETRRRRGDGEDWNIVRLGVPGRVRQIRLDTCHFKGNYPPRAVVEGLCWPDAPITALPGAAWRPLLPEVALGADAEHDFDALDVGPVTHLRLRIRPCGGVARLRAFGDPEAPAASDDPLLVALNGLSDADATAALLRCCGSTRWAARLVAARPFVHRDHLHGEAERLWWWLDEVDWREAFTHHPRIGADLDTLRAKYAATATWSQGEQSGVADADEAVLRGLADGNRDYEARFGFVFLVCATGKTAAEMLALLRARMGNRPDDEVRVAAAEQAKITRLRLEKLT